MLHPVKLSVTTVCARAVVQGVQRVTLGWPTRRQKVMFGSRPTALYARRLVDEQRAGRGSGQDASAASSNEQAPAEQPAERKQNEAGETEAAAAAGGASDQRGGGECESGSNAEDYETVEGETEVLQEVAAWRIGGLSKPISSHKGKVRKRSTRGLVEG